MLRRAALLLSFCSFALAGGAFAQSDGKPPEGAQAQIAAPPVEAQRALLERLRQEADTRPRAGWEAGMLILRGVDPSATPADAYALIRQAAERGDENAMISTAVMLATAEGVAENDVEAREWYLRAARHGSAHALRAYGAMLFVGEGGPIDLIRGRAYVEMAHEAGEPNAARLLALFNRLPATAEQRERVEAAKDTWRAANPPLR